MYMTNHLVCNNNSLSLHDVFKICQNVGILRLVKTEEDEKYIRIFICGIYRIQKNKQSGKVSMWGYKLNDKDSGVWCRRNSLPGNVHLFWSKKAAFDMGDWIERAIKYIIKSLIETGYSIDDKLYLYRVRAINGKSQFISTLSQSYVYDYLCEDLCTCLGKIQTFQYPTNVKYISKHELLEQIEKKIYHRAYKVIGVDNEFNASKSLSKNIWAMVNKNIFTKYAKASHCSITYNSVRKAMFEDYLDFSKRIYIEDNVDFGGLWPMVGRLRRQHKTGRFILSGKTKELFENLTFPCNLSYGDFRRLRHNRLSLISALNDSRYESFRLITRLLHNPLIKRFPVKVIWWIIEYLETRYRSRYEKEDDIYRVCSKWLEYHRDLFKNIGFREHHLEPWIISRWETEKNFLCHAIDWLLDEEPLIHKNQEWPSFWRLSDEWTQRVRQNATAAIKEWRGTGINWQEIDKFVKELITFDALCNEGQEMEHCVASYAHWCASGEYLVFSVSMENERATLGLSRTEHNVTYQFDQMRGVHNHAVSRNMLNKGKHILKIINSNLTKNNSV
ncbi:hypothetical protein FT916_13170 [Salmonella enterica]|nr:hypothetical protein [Salmonella enterica]